MKPVPLSKVKNLNRFERKQTKLKFSDLFPNPKKKGRCKCGCKQKVVYPRRLWATKACTKKALEYYEIIKGYHRTIRRLLYRRDRGVCAACGSDCGRRDWNADHIVEVVNGGGGCELSNYQTLCLPCHKTKTRNLVKLYA